jgi:phospholipid/cholesterol/gamma-HCH transport system substrate-binding protein
MIEALLGAVVLIIAVIFMMFAYKMADLRATTGYDLHAKFDKIGALKMGSDVRIGGIKVGTITGLGLDPKTYYALVKITVDNAVQLPVDSVAEVGSEGLLGGQFLQIVPGSEENMIPPGGAIKFTQSPVDLVQLLGRFIFSGADNAKNKEKESDAAPAATPAAAPTAAAPVLAK